MPTVVPIDSDLKDQFWSLADPKDTLRQKGAQAVVSKFSSGDNEVKSYCIKRLIRGLASPRLASRLGFSVSLCEILRATSSYTVVELLQIVDSELPLDEGEASNNAIGQALAINALIHSGFACRGAELESLSTLIERILLIVKLKPFLESLCFHSISGLTTQLELDDFKSHIWPHLKTVCRCDWTQCSPSVLWLLLDLKQRFPKFMQKKVALLSSPVISAEKFSVLTDLMTESYKSCPSIHPMNFVLLKHAFESEDSELLKSFWSSVMETGLICNPDHGVRAFGLRLISYLFKEIGVKMPVDYILMILSPVVIKELVKMFLQSASHTSRSFMRLIAVRFVNDLSLFAKQLREANCHKHLVAIVRAFFDACPNFDSVSNYSFLTKMIEDQMSSAALELCLTHFRSYLENLQLKLNSPEVKIPLETIGAVKMLRVCFCHLRGQQYNDQKSEILVLMFNKYQQSLLVVPSAGANSGSTGSGQMNNAFAHFQKFLKSSIQRMLDSLFTVPLVLRRHNELAERNRDNAISILLQTANGLISSLKKSSPGDSPLDAECIDLCYKYLKSVKSLHKRFPSKDVADFHCAIGFQILLLYSVVLALLNDTSSEDFAKEAASCLERSPVGSGQEKENVKNGDNGENDEQPFWMEVLVELLLEQLSKSNRFCRSIITEAFNCFCGYLTTASSDRLLDVLSPTDTLEGSDDEDAESADEMDSENETHRKPVLNLNGDAADANVTKHSISKRDHDIPVVKNESSRVTVNGHGHESAEEGEQDEVESVEMDDEAMASYDGMFSAIFREKIEMKQAVALAAAFRMHILDLLFCYVNSDRPNAVLVARIAVKLLEFSDVSAKSGQKKFSNKMSAIVIRIVKLKGLETSSDSVEQAAALQDCMSSFLSFAQRGVCPALHGAAGRLFEFLYRICAENKELEQVHENINSKASDSLKEFMKNSSCLYHASLFTSLLRCHSVSLCKVLPHFGHWIFDSDIRPPRKVEGYELVKCFLDKKFLSATSCDESVKKAIHKFLSRFVSRFRKVVEELLSSLKQEETDTKDEESAKDNKLDGALAETVQASILKMPKYLAALLSLLDTLVDGLRKSSTISLMASLCDDTFVTECLEPLASRQFWNKPALKKIREAFATSYKKPIHLAVAAVIKQLRSSQADIGMETSEDEPFKKKAKIE